MTTPTREQIEAEFASFIEYPSEDKRYVTTVSCLLFAEHIARIAHTAGRAQGLREASYPADFEPIAFLVGVEMWVKAAYQKGGDRLWKITRGFGEVLNKQGQWEREPSASNRTDEFLARCRYATLDECAAAIEQLRGK